jgi:hypothetical protein
MNAFAACIRRETWVLVVQAVPFSSGRSGCSCTKESHPAHVGGNQCEGGYTQLSKASEVKSRDKSPRGTNSGRAWLGPETPPYALQSQPCDLIDTIDLMDTARLVRCISSTTQAKVYHLSIRLIRALGYAANREEENMHRRHANPLHAFALGGQPGETGLHSNINQTATEASINPIQKERPGIVRLAYSPRRAFISLAAKRCPSVRPVEKMDLGKPQFPERNKAKETRRGRLSACNLRKRPW